MKTIDFELSKRLNDLGLLDDVETGKTVIYNPDDNQYYVSISPMKPHYQFIKVLNLEEAIEFLKNEIGIACDFIIRNKHNIGWHIEGNFEEPEPNMSFNGKTLIQVVEKVIEYLLDNNLLNN